MKIKIKSQNMKKYFMETSLAGSATLGDTSWARLIIQPGPSNTQKKAICDFILQAKTWQILHFA